MPAPFLTTLIAPEITPELAADPALYVNVPLATLIVSPAAPAEVTVFVEPPLLLPVTDARPAIC